MLEIDATTTTMTQTVMLTLNQDQRRREKAIFGLTPLPKLASGVQANEFSPQWTTKREAATMADIVKAAIAQLKWTGDKESMLDEHERSARDAAKQGAKVMCFQELFYGPYFCQVQDAEFYDYAEAVPDGSTTQRFAALAKELDMVLVLPVYEEEQPGILYNTAAVIDADGTYLGKYRKTHIPQVKGFWEKFYFRPGNLGYPVFDTAVGKVGVYICYDRHFPEGWRALGLAGAQIVFNPSATSRGLSQYLWELEQTASAAANMYFVGAINRIGIEPLGDNDFYGTSYSADPRGQIFDGAASAHDEELVVRDLDLSQVAEVRNQWAFYRDRRPDMYGPLVEG
ncbi:apolipoprotein acyltransferase [soil metagenome]